MPLPPLPALSAVVGPIYLLAFITQDGMGSDRGGGGWGGGEGGGASSEAMAGYQLMVSRALLALPIALLLVSLPLRDYARWHGSRPLSYSQLVEAGQQPGRHGIHDEEAVRGDAAAGALDHALDHEGSSQSKIGMSAVEWIRWQFPRWADARGV